MSINVWCTEHERDARVEPQRSSVGKHVLHSHESDERVSLAKGIVPGHVAVHKWWLGYVPPRPRLSASRPASHLRGFGSKKYELKHARIRAYVHVRAAVVRACVRADVWASRSTYQNKIDEYARAVSHTDVPHSSALGAQGAAHRCVRCRYVYKVHPTRVAENALMNT